MLAKILVGVEAKILALLFQTQSFGHEVSSLKALLMFTTCKTDYEIAFVVEISRLASTKLLFCLFYFNLFLKSLTNLKFVFDLRYFS